MSSKPRQALESWIKSLKIKADRVLDVGGAQKPVKGRTGEWDVKEYLISDIEFPHDNSPKPDIVFDLSKFKYNWRIIGHNGIALDEPGCGGDHPEDVEIETVPDIDNSFKYCENFDVVFCLEVMEYVSDPVQAIKNLNRLLKQGGKLYISFNFSYPTHNPPGLDYFRYTRFGVIKLLEDNGFKIDKLTPRTCEMNTGYPELMQFYSKQGMKYTKDIKGIHEETGHLCECHKL